MKRVVALLALAAATPADARRHHDGYDTPTDTHVDLVLGLWHDDALRPGEGWHRYGFTAEATGDVAVQMRAPVDAKTVWSYLRVDGGGTSWAGVGNRRTNLCEIILHVERGAHYEVIATSQRNASLGPTERPIADGPYTIAVVPLARR